MHDGVSFERLGKPALVICTRPFEPTGRVTATTLGLPHFQFALVDHPIGSVSAEALRRRAEDAYAQLLPVLLGEHETNGSA